MSIASLSPLDSERFGIVVARADGVQAGAIAELAAFCAEQEVALLVARCDGADQAAARALIGAGLVSVEAQITYRGALTQAADEPGIRVATSADADAVAELARAGFDDYAGHYHADPRLPHEACRDVYVDWALRGVAGEAADVAYVAQRDGVVAAFGLFTHDGGDDMQYQLATVAPAARGRGLYSALLRHGMAWGARRGASSVLGVVAHGTIGAHRNLLRAGLVPVAATTTFHGWDLR